MKAIDLGQTTIELVNIPSGKFKMGSPNKLYSEAPMHEVTIADEFYFGKYLITQHQWENVMGKNPSYFRISALHPVDSISCEDATEFCHKLSESCGRDVRLPSESEWEYACRGGTESEFFFASTEPFIDETGISSKIRQVLQEYAWFDENASAETHAIGLKKPNPWGLHDIVGNVWEWCVDVWHSHYDGAPRDGSPWLSGSDRQPRRCLRGGAWDMDAFRCRSTYRSWDWKDMAKSQFGLRIVVET